MSGFAAELRLDGAAGHVESANAMCGALQVFGRDRQEVAIDGGFAFAWVQSAGYFPQDALEHQPAEADARWKMFFLGRLLHREELGHALGLSRREIEQAPDCDLALKAWCKWGEDCRKHLYGGFSLLVCDVRENRTIAIRSPERSQQLYVFQDRARLVVASSVKAIFALPDVPRELDDTKLADILVLNHEDTSRSYFRGISVIGQSCTFTAGRDEQAQTRFHDFLAEAPLVTFARDADYVDRAEELFAAAVAECFRVPGTPAISLSGGLDSTLMAVFMLDHMERAGIDGQLKAYTGVPEKGWVDHALNGQTGDESAQVLAMARMYPRLDVNFVHCDSLAGGKSSDATQMLGDAPVRGINNSSWGSGIALRCRQDGHRLLANGSAGNGNISFSAASQLFAAWLRRGRIDKLLREIPKFVAHHPGKRSRTLLHKALIANMPHGLQEKYVDWRGLSQSKGYAEFSAINPAFAEGERCRERLKDLDWDDRYRLVPDRRGTMRLFLQRGARNDSGAFFEATRALEGIEHFSPYEDRRLMAYCYAIPDDQFYRDGIDRRLVRRMAARRLPREVLHGPKGQQAADWHARRTREVPAMLEEIERCEDMPDIATKLDLKRMKAVLENWPDEAPLSRMDDPDFAMQRYGVARALSVARFIRQVDGRN